MYRRRMFNQRHARIKPELKSHEYLQSINQANHKVRLATFGSAR